MYIRKYDAKDCREITELFYNTVHTVNAKDYTEEQLNAWTVKSVDYDKWNRSLAEHFTLVAVEDGVITGFGDIDGTGYLDRLYVHRDYQRRGTATALCDRLENYINGDITVHSSITARPFFEHRGYRVIKEQQVPRNGVLLTNFVMLKKYGCG